MESSASGSNFASVGSVSCGSPAPSDSQEKRVSWVELFFDLVFVFAVTQVSGLLHADHTWPGVGRSLVVFVPVYWAWVGTTMLGNLSDVDRLPIRLGIFAVGLCGLFMALAIPHAYGETAILFGASYWAARIVLFPLTRRPYTGVGFNPFVAGVLISGPLLLAGGLAHGSVRVGLWAAAAAVDLSVPYLARRRMADVSYVPSHLAERFGLFIIIALGESVVAAGVAAGEHPLTALRLIAVAVAFATTCSLWWLYFAFCVEQIRVSLEVAEQRFEAVRSVLPYGHIGLLAGIILIAAGLGEVIAEPAGHLHGDTAALLFGGAALYLLMFAYTSRRGAGMLPFPRLVAAAVSVAMLLFATRVPAIAALLGLAALLGSLNLYEAQVQSRRATTRG